MTPSDNTNPEEEKGIFSDPSLWKLNTNPVVKESLTTQKEEMKREKAEMNSAYLRQLFDASDKVDALQSENDQLKKEATLYRDLYSKSVEACLWMHDDKSLGLQLGSDLTTEGVAALRKQRDQLKRDNEILKNEERPFFIKWINSVKEQLTTAHKVIDQCEEALNKVLPHHQGFHSENGKRVKELLSTIQSLKLKGK